MENSESEKEITLRITPELFNFNREELCDDKNVYIKEQEKSKIEIQIIETDVNFQTRSAKVEVVLTHLNRATLCLKRR